MLQRHAVHPRPSIKSAAMLVGVSLLVAAAASQAAVITSLPDGTTHAFGAMNLLTAGAVQENGMTFTSTNASSVYGYDGSYGLGPNGSWDGDSPYIGLNAGNDASQYMTVTFDDAVASVLSFVNYAPGYGSSYIAVYDATNQLIESLALSFATPGGMNAGSSFGFSESSNIIKSIRFGDAYIVARDIQSAAAAVPVPGTLPLIGLGIAGLVAMTRCRKVDVRPALPTALTA